MAKFRVIRPWFGVKMGQIVTLKEVHPALRPNVVPAGDGEPKESDAAAKALDAAKAEAAAIVDAAKTEAKTIVDAANEQADAIKAEAAASAQAPQPEAGDGKGGDLTPATPDATADKPKATKTK